MKALVCEAYGPIDTLVLKDIPTPEPGKGHVLIDVKAAAANFADALIVQGLYQVKPPLPFSPGAEISGIVKAVGEGVKHVKPGDKVIAIVGQGGFAEACLSHASTVMLLPEGMSFDQGAALVLTYCTSLHGLKDCGQLKAGESLVVMGAAGGVGVAAVEIGKALGANVIAAASSDEKLELCKKLGADAVINYSTENLKDRIMALTDGRGADVVYDPVGGPYTEPALRALAWHGRLLVIGFAAGDIPKIPINLTLLKERSIIGVYWGDSVKHDPKGHMANLMQLNQWFANGQIKPLVSERFSLEQAKDALKKLASRGVVGKVVIAPGGL